MSERRLIAGVDLGGTKIYTLVATAEGEVLGDDRHSTTAVEGPDAVIDRLIESVRQAVESAGASLGDLLGVGISAPGPLDPDRGVVVDAPNLPGWRNVPLGPIVSERLGVPTVLENDAAAACYGEHRFGAGRGCKHIVYVTLGTGIGGGIMIDGQIYGGASGAAGEVGHISVESEGPPCNCGSRGCVETLASGRALARDAAAVIEEGRSPVLAELAGGEPPTAETLLEAAHRGDAVSREMLERAGCYLGLGLAAALNSFNPQALILGGGLVSLGDLYLEPAFRTARERAFDEIVAEATFSLAELGNRSGALGAAALVLARQPK